MRRLQARTAGSCLRTRAAKSQAISSPIEGAPFTDDSQRNCRTCFAYLEFVGPAATNWRLFRAQRGAITFDRFDRNPSEGGLAVRMTNVVLIEWDFAKDLPVPNGECLMAETVTLKTEWKK